jgi:hypothetical protein
MGMYVYGMYFSVNFVKKKSIKFSSYKHLFNIVDLINLNE